MHDNETIRKLVFSLEKLSNTSRALLFSFNHSIKHSGQIEKTVKERSFSVELLKNPAILQILLVKETNHGSMFFTSHLMKPR